MRLCTLILCALVATVAFAADDVGAPKPFDAKWTELRKPDLVEKAFLELLPAARKADDADHLAQLLSQIARTHSARGNFKQAHKWLDEAEQVLGESQGVGRVRVLLERGRAYNSARDVGKAGELFTKAFELATELKADNYIVDSAHMLGICEEPKKALAWNLKAIELAKASKSEHGRRWLGSLYNNTGWSYFEAADYEKALDFFTRSAAFRNERKASDAIARWSMAKSLRMLKRYDEALAIQKKLEAEYEAKGSVNGFVFEELAEVLWATGKKDEAKSYFRRAYETLGKIGWVASDTKRMEGMRTRAGLPAPAKDDESPDESDESESDNGE